MTSVLEGVEYLHCDRRFPGVFSTLVGSKCYCQHAQGYHSKTYAYVALLLRLLWLIVVLDTVVLLVLASRDLGWTDGLSLTKHNWTEEDPHTCATFCSHAIFTIETLLPFVACLIKKL